MTDQPRQIVAATSLTDPIRVFLGNIPDDEHEQRRRIGVARNAGSWKAHNTDNGIARTLAWIAAEVATQRIYAPAPVEELQEVSAFLLSLLTAADRAEILGAGE